MASADVIGGGNMEPRALEEEMRTAYLDYAMSVIVGRALPDVRDGLKPVQRRILYTMYHDLHLTFDGRPRKCSKIIGDVIGNYHPHETEAAYDARARQLVGLFQANFKNYAAQVSEAVRQAGLRG